MSIVKFAMGTEGDRGSSCVQSYHVIRLNTCALWATLRRGICGFFFLWLSTSDQWPKLHLDLDAVSNQTILIPSIFQPGLTFYIHRVLGSCRFQWCSFHLCAFSKNSPNIQFMRFSLHISKGIPSLLLFLGY